MMSDLHKLISQIQEMKKIILDHHLDEFVTERYKRQEDQCQKKTKRHDAKSASFHSQTAQKHRLSKRVFDIALSIESDLPTESLNDIPPDPVDDLQHAPHLDDLFSLNPSSLKDIPENLITVLKLTESDKLCGKVVDLLEIAGRPLNVQELIIGLYRKFEIEIKDRNPFASKLYRFVQSGNIASIDGKRGYYQLPEKNTEADIFS